ncbi:MAG: hypothetical protein CFE44_12045 [Burkholderiales bacterium PBB4]|nr:MAG: hypothetical protein CFE44_12045 [Burkholderiales bacterium PBB4]
MSIRFNSRAAGALATCLLLACGTAKAADVIVKVTGTNSTVGQIRCGLFENSPAFPMDPSGAKQVSLSADAGALVCKFSGVAPGTYAVSVGHDANGNKKVDTNFLGIPTEGWGVSNNVVPRLRAPRFDEAQFVVKEGSNVELEVKLVY